MSRILNAARVALGWSVVSCGAVVFFAALGARMVREYGEPGDWDHTIATDGTRLWQVWALLCVFGTGAVLIANAWSDRPHWWLLAPPITGFVLVALHTRAWHDRLLAEQAGPRTYIAQIPVRPPTGPAFDEHGFPLTLEPVTRIYGMQIPGGMEIVITASAIAAGLTIILMLLYVIEDFTAGRRWFPEQGAASIS